MRLQSRISAVPQSHGTLLPAGLLRPRPLRALCIPPVVRTDDFEASFKLTAQTIKNLTLKPEGCISQVLNHNIIHNISCKTFLQLTVYVSVHRIKGFLIILSFNDNKRKVRRSFHRFRTEVSMESFWEFNRNFPTPFATLVSSRARKGADSAVTPPPGVT